MTCPSELTLSAYADDELAAAEAASLATHLSGCARCRVRVDGLRGEAGLIAAALAHDPYPVEVPAFRTPARYRPLAAAAALAALAAALVPAAHLLIGGAVPTPLVWLNPLDSGSAADLAIGAVLFAARHGVSIMMSIAETAALAVVVGLVAWVTLALGRRGPGPLLLASLACVVVALPPTSHAFEIRRGEEAVLIPASEIIDDTLIAVGETVEVDGDVKGDLIAFGRRVAIRGTVGGQLITGAETLTIDGEVAGSVIGFGRNLDVASPRIGGNLYGFGSTTRLDSAVSIDQNAVLFAQRATVEGPVARDVIGFAEDIEVGSRIGGELTAFANRLTLLAPARIAGDVTAHLPAEDHLTVSPTAVVEGEVITDVSERPDERNEYLTGSFYLAQILRFAAAFLTGVVVLWLLPGLRQMSLDSVSNTLVAGGLGLVTLVAAPIIALLALFTIIGIPVAVVGLVLWLLGIYLAKVVLAHFIGTRVVEAAGSERSFAVALAVGLLIVIVVVNVPWIGGVVNFLLTICGLGLLVLYLWYAIVEDRPATQRAA